MEQLKENTTEINATNTESALIFKHFPKFAAFVRDNFLVPYIQEQLRLSKELNLPMLKYFSQYTDDEIIELGKEGHSAFLTAIEENKGEEYLSQSLKVWEDDKLGFLGRDDIAAEDLTLASYIRRYALQKFIPKYTQDTLEALDIINDIDAYTKESDIAAVNMYIYLLQERISESEKLYKQAQAIGNLGNWNWDLHNNKVTWSEEIYRIYELPVGEELSFEKIRAYRHPEDAEGVMSKADAAIKDHKPYNITYRIILPSGEIKHLNARGEVMRNEKGEAYKVVGTLQDITQQKKYEQELRTSREFIQKVANTTPSLIITYNVKTNKYVFINNAIEQLLGYPATDIFTKGVTLMRTLVHPEDRDMVDEKHKDIILLPKAADNGSEDKEKIVEFKYRIKHADGEYRWFYSYGTVFDRDEQGNVEHALYVSVDITEQEEAEQELQAKNEQLKISNQSLQEFAYIASHDLKEPLRKITTFSDRLLIKQRDNLTEDGRTYLDKIIDSSQRMQQMITDILSLSMISGNKQYEKTNINDVVNEVRNTLEYKIAEKNAVIKATKLPIAPVVPSQMRQLFQNLISNSIKFVKDGTKPVIQIKCKMATPATLKQVALPKGKYYEITISDNGIGFDNSYAERIFNIFNRLHGKHEYEGTGIGLAICKKIAENHNGKIWAEGEQDKGATFHLILPARQHDIFT